MKRQNYYQVHKNKKPKKLRKSNPSRFVIQVAIISMQSFAQHAIIVSQQFNSVIEKTLAVVENVKNHAEAISNLTKNKNGRTSIQARRTNSTSRKLYDKCQKRRIIE
jgi:hypothetical protein